MFLAKIAIYGPEQGGRTRKVGAGYSPHIRVEDEKTTCFLYPVDEKIAIFDFNRAYLVNLRLLLPEYYQDRLSVGEMVELYEGSKKVGEGVLLGFIEGREIMSEEQIQLYYRNCFLALLSYQKTRKQIYSLA